MKLVLLAFLLCAAVNMCLAEECGHGGVPMELGYGDAGGFGTECSSLNPCGECLGDCDSDDECEGNLVCMQRTSFSPSVPGCAESGESGEASYHDYCYDPAKATAPFHKLAYGTGSPGSDCTSAEPCGECFGDCDSDSDCVGDLLCFQRTSYSPSVPGCFENSGSLGTAFPDHDYCYDPQKSLSLLAYGPGSAGSDCTSANPCGECLGDCDNDSDCAGTLKCFQRNDYSQGVPGCLENAALSPVYLQHDYCYDPAKVPNEVNMLSYGPGSAGSDCTSSNPCDVCLGDCDYDSDCKGNLLCMQRNANSPAVPGCLENGLDEYPDHDYCYDPAALDAPVDDIKCDCTGTGFEGETCENNIDDCANDPCPCFATCSDGINYYDCDFGSFTSNTCIECTANGGLCVNTASYSTSYTDPYCECASGMTGFCCQDNIDDCSPNVCNSGTCEDGLNSYTCLCDPGKSGTNCEIIDYCYGSPCVHGTCSSGESSYTCNCDTNWGGSKCDVAVDHDVAVPAACVPTCLYRGTCGDDIGDFLDFSFGTITFQGITVDVDQALLDIFTDVTGIDINAAVTLKTRGRSWSGTGDTVRVAFNGLAAAFHFRLFFKPTTKATEYTPYVAYVCPGALADLDSLSLLWDYQLWKTGTDGVGIDYIEIPGTMLTPTIGLSWVAFEATNNQWAGPYKKSHIPYFEYGDNLESCGSAMDLVFPQEGTWTDHKSWPLCIYQYGAELVGLKIYLYIGLKFDCATSSACDLTVTNLSTFDPTGSIIPEAVCDPVADVIDLLNIDLNPCPTVAQMLIGVDNILVIPKAGSNLT